jgi:hypothetical protein
VVFCRSEEEVQAQFAKYDGPYRYSFSSLDGLVSARIPPLVLTSACESFGKRVAKNLNPKKVWNIMSDQTKEVAKAEAAGKTADAAQQKKAAAAAKKKAAEDKKAADEKAKADKKAAAEKEKADKKAAADKKKADAEQAKKDKEAGKVVDNRIIRVLKSTAEFRGKRAEAFASLKDGMTVSEWVALAGPIFNDGTAGAHLLGIYLVKELVKLDPPAAPAELSARQA